MSRIFSRASYSIMNSTAFAMYEGKNRPVQTCGADASRKNPAAQNVVIHPLDMTPSP